MMTKMLVILFVLPVVATLVAKALGWGSMGAIATYLTTAFIYDIMSHRCNAKKDL